MFIASFKLIKPLNCMFWNNVKSIVSSFIFCFSIISPFICTWNIDQNPVVLKSPHGNVCQDHGFSCSSVSSQKDILERWCLIEKVSKVRWLRFDFNSFVAFEFSESFSKITSRWCDWHLHDLLNFCFNEFKGIFFN